MLNKHTHTEPHFRQQTYRQHEFLCIKIINLFQQLNSLFKVFINKVSLVAAMRFIHGLKSMAFSLLLLT